MCGDELEVSTPRRRYSRLIICNVPDGVITENTKKVIMKKTGQEKGQQFSDRSQLYDENEILGEENEK